MLVTPKTNGQFADAADCISVAFKPQTCIWDRHHILWAAYNVHVKQVNAKSCCFENIPFHLKRVNIVGEQKEE